MKSKSKASNRTVLSIPMARGLDVHATDLLSQVSDTESVEGGAGSDSIASLRLQITSRN